MMYFCSDLSIFVQYLLFDWLLEYMEMQHKNAPKKGESGTT